MSLRPAEIESTLSALDIRRPFRYVRGRVYTLAVRVHYELFFGRHIGDDPTGSGRAAVMMYRQLPRARREGLAQAARSHLLAPLCAVQCEVVGGDVDCTCLGVDEFRAQLETRLVNTPAMPAPDHMTPAPFTGTPYDLGSELD